MPVSGREPKPAFGAARRQGQARRALRAAEGADVECLDGAGRAAARQEERRRVGQACISSRANAASGSGAPTAARRQTGFRQGQERCGSSAVSFAAGRWQPRAAIRSARPPTAPARRCSTSWRIASPSKLDGARVLDLFAGTGALGLEALSRGASFCLFIEESAEGRGLIRDNVESFRADRPQQDLSPRRDRARRGRHDAAVRPAVCRPALWQGPRRACAAIGAQRRLARARRAVRRRGSRCRAIRARSRLFGHRRARLWRDRDPIDRA